MRMSSSINLPKLNPGENMTLDRIIKLYRSLRTFENIAKNLLDCVDHGKTRVKYSGTGRRFFALVFDHIEH